MKRLTTMAAVLLSAACGTDTSGPGEAPALFAEWRATHVRDLPLPNAIYVFDPVELDGDTVSAHFVVDSARLIVRENGTYAHDIWVTQWLGAAGGPPQYATMKFKHGDHGGWTRTGSAVAFESHWLMNHRMSGELGSDGVLRMQHGFTHGDPPVALRYGAE